MIALLDADFLVYRVCYAKDKEYDQMLEILDWYIHDILDKTEASEYKIFLSGTSNFRKEISPAYKATRKKEKPPFYHDVRDYIVTEWKAEVSENCEADDLCGLHQKDDSIVVGEDKDLLTIPGWHYRITKNWTDNQKLHISEDDAKRNFFVQCLTGDKIDNIPGLVNPEKLHHKKPPNFTEETANSILEGKTIGEMKESVIELYKQIHGDDWYEKFDQVCRLLFLRRKTATEYYSWINP